MKRGRGCGRSGGVQVGVTMTVPPGQGGVGWHSGREVGCGVGVGVGVGRGIVIAMTAESIHGLGVVVAAEVVGVSVLSNRSCKCVLESVWQRSQQCTGCHCRHGHDISRRHGLGVVVAAEAVGVSMSSCPQSTNMMMAIESKTNGVSARHERAGALTLRRSMTISAGA